MPIEFIAVLLTMLVMGFLIVATVRKWLLVGQREGRKKERKKITPLIGNAEQAKAKVQSLGLPPVFTAVWEDKIPPEFVLWQKPSRYFSYLNEILERFPRMASCVPLWESNRDHVYAYDLNNGEFVVCDYCEEPSLEVLANNYQGFAAAELVDSAYAGSDDLEVEAAHLEFHYLDRLLKWAAIDDESVDPSEAKRQFVASIPPGR